MIFPKRSISNTLTALSRSEFLTTIVILDSEGFWEIIITLIPAFAKVANILAAVPGVPIILPPLISINPLLRILLTHFTVFFTEAEGDAVTKVPSLLVLNEFLIFIGIFLANRGSNVLGWICLAPNKAISIASV